MIETEPEYYDAFVDSILSLPASIRSFVLNIGALHSKNNDPYQYLWETYCNEKNETDFLHKLLDLHCLAID